MRSNPTPWWGKYTYYPLDFLDKIDDNRIYIYILVYRFLLNHKRLALPALQICLEVFSWTDGEATTKVCCFCGVVVLLAILTNNVELREFVSKDLFSAVIGGLGMESNAINSPDLVNLCREIFIYLSDRDPAPRQVSFSHMVDFFLP